jgi:hypothetical protein
MLVSKEAVRYQFLSVHVVHCELDGRNYSDIHCLECAKSKWDTEKGIVCEFRSPPTIFRLH